MMRWMIAAVAVGAASLLTPPPTQAATTKVARADWSKTIVATPEGGMRIGNPAAKVKLIEYGSRTCPHCAHFDADGVPALKAGLIAAGQVSYEYRDFPVHNILDIGPILLGRCVPTRAFFPILDAMMRAQSTLVGRSDEIPADKQKELQTATPNAVATYLAKFYGYTDLVVTKGLPLAKANACLGDKKRLDAVVAQAAAGSKTYKISSTPTFIVNGTPQANVYDWATLEPVLRAAIAK